MTPSEARKAGLDVNLDGVRRSAFDLLAREETGLTQLLPVWPELGGIDSATWERLVTEARYAVYLQRQEKESQVVRLESERRLPDSIDFGNLRGLSNELKQKIAVMRPRTVSDAQRIDGMTPAALALILAHARQFEHSAEQGAA